LGAGPAFAGLPGDSLTWRLILTEGQAGAVQAVRAKQEPNVVQPLVLSPSRAEPGATGQESARKHPALPAVSRAEAMPGGVAMHRASQRTPEAMRPTDTAPGSPDGMAAASTAPAALRGLAARPGVTTELPAVERRSQEPDLIEPQVLHATDTLAGTTDLDSARERPAIPESLRPVETMPGDVGMHRAAQRTPEDLSPVDAVASDPEAQPTASRPRLDDVQRWTALEAFAHDGQAMVAFNVANRLSIARADNLPTPLAWLDLSGFVLDIEVVDLGAMRYALLALGSEGIAVVDVNDPARPTLVAEVQAGYMAGGILFSMDHADALPGDASAIDSIVSDGTTLWLHDWNYGLQRTPLENLLGSLRAER
jgi:hypothetical protein